MSSTVLIGCVIVAAIGLLLILVALVKKSPSGRRRKTAKHQSSSEVITEKVDGAIEQVFNTEFREELRNRGRLYFEKIINENAMFLQQDLRLTTSQLNEFMKDQIKKTLQEEFSKYEESITGAKDIAIQSIEKTQAAIEEQRQILEKQLVEQVASEKARVIEKFAANMADIINHYIVTAIGKELDLTDQLDYIFDYLEENKQAIVEDISRGA